MGSFHSADAFRAHSMTEQEVFLRIHGQQQKNTEAIQQFLPNGGPSLTSPAELPAIPPFRSCITFLTNMSLRSALGQIVSIGVLFALLSKIRRFSGVESPSWRSCFKASFTYWVLDESLFPLITVVYRSLVMKIVRRVADYMKTMRPDIIFGVEPMIPMILRFLFYGVESVLRVLQLKLTSSLTAGFNIAGVLRLLINSILISQVRYRIPLAN